MNEPSDFVQETPLGARENEHTIRVVLADDHPVILLGARHALARFSDIDVVAEARQSTDLITLLSNTTCNALVTDLAMPGGRHGDGLPLIGYVRRHFPTLAVVVLTMLENAALIRRLGEMGVTSIVSKSDDLTHIGLAIRHVVRGRPYAGPSVRAILEAIPAGAGRRCDEVSLSAREIEVVRLFAAGMTVTEIAERLNRSIKTVSSHKTAALRKLGLERDSELYQYAQSAGLTHLSSESGELPR